MASIFSSMTDFSKSAASIERRLNGEDPEDTDDWGPKVGADKNICTGEDVGKPWCCCYDLANDWLGPQFFFPVQCIRQTSFMIPRVASPNIAIIGKKDELNYIE